MHDFTYKSYLSLIQEIQKLNYTLGPLCEFPETGNAVILRHDIDFSIFKALEMAKIENQKGIRATYFVLMSSPFYNPLSLENLNALKEIHQLGHEIGLHYDCSLFEELSQEQMNQRMQLFINMLEGMLGIEISSISQHKPATSKIHPKFSQYRDAYASQYTKEIAYLSDSRMHFGASDVVAFFKEHPRSQLVIHPVWWNEKALDRKTVFKNFKATATQELLMHIEAFEKGIETYFENRKSLQHEKELLL